MPAIIVRPLTPDDVAAYRALRLAGIAELPAAFCTTHAAESGLPLAQIAQRLRATSHQIIFGAFDKDQLIGIAGLRREPIAVVHDKASLWSVYGRRRRAGAALHDNWCRPPSRMPAPSPNWPACAWLWRRTTTRH